MTGNDGAQLQHQIQSIQINILKMLTAAPCYDKNYKVSMFPLLKILQKSL